MSIFDILGIGGDKPHEVRQGPFGTLIGRHADERNAERQAREASRGPNWFGHSRTSTHDERGPTGNTFFGGRRR